MLKKPQEDFQSYGKMVFTDKKFEEEWNSLEPGVKNFALKNLERCCDEMETKISIKMLCKVVEEMQNRIDALEEMTKHNK